MKIAEEVAEEVFIRVLVIPEVLAPADVKREIAQALIAYASEAAAGMQTTMKEMADRWIKRARAEALEEAAKVAEIPLCNNDAHCRWICATKADEIRALKAKP